MSTRPVPTPLDPPDAGAHDTPGGQPPQPPRGPDRRRAPTSPWSAFDPRGRRTAARRDDERRGVYYVDRFRTRLLVPIVLLLLLTIVDGVLTLLLLDSDFEEANPVMRVLLRQGAVPFVLGKYALTAWGLPLLLVVKNHYLFRSRVRVVHLLPTFVGLYVILLAYQIGLLVLYPKQAGRIGNISNAAAAPDASRPARPVGVVEPTGL